MRVLVVDDSPLVRETFKLLLGEDRVETAASVREALERLARDDDLRIVMADLSMEGGGTAFLRTLRDRFADRAVIVISGDLSGLDDVRARELGVLRRLEKSQARLADFEEAIEAAEVHLRSLVRAE